MNNKMYEAPTLQIICVEVEQGFYGSGYTGPTNTTGTGTITGGSASEDWDGGGSITPGF